MKPPTSKPRAGGLGKAPATCTFPTAKAKSQAIGDFLRRHGDGLPEPVLRKATAVDKLKSWTTFCDHQGIAAAMRHEHTDWYLCTLKNAAVRPDLRGRGLGRELYQRTTESASRDPKCLVLAADVTHDNAPSIKALRRAGFQEVNQFCWGRDEKPASILHLVRLPPTKGSKCP